MTYEPLHHKYRPQRFADLVGQEAIATTLTHAIEQQRIAPAYLFCGPRGTGKTSSARILAKSLNCISVAAPTASPCGTCAVCRAIAVGSALDVIEIDAASNTGVDNIRELIEKSQFAPVQCRYKVYAIDECHMLSTAAFNALLKTLEEPPDRVVFVLATTDPQRVLPTIISRCQRFDFRRIPLDAMVGHLRMIADQENINITNEAITLVAQIAQGGLRDAESLLDQLSLLTDGVTVEKVWDLVGAVPERDLLALVQAIAQDHPETVLDCTRHLMDRGREPLVILQSLASFYRDLLIAKTAPNRGDLVAVTADTWQQLQKFVQIWDVSLILAAQQHLRACEVQVKNTTQPRLWLEVILLGLLPSAIAPAVAPVSLPTTTPAPSIPASRSASPSPIPASTPTPPPSDLWQQILNHIALPSTRALMQQMGHLISFDGKWARIGLQPQVHKKRQANLAKDINTIEAALMKAGYPSVKVTLEAAGRRNETEVEADSTASLATDGTEAQSDRPPVATVPSIPDANPAPIYASPTSAPTRPAVSEPVVTDSARVSNLTPESVRLPITEAGVMPTLGQLGKLDLDEVERAAQSLAKLFNGQIIDDEISSSEISEVPLSGESGFLEDEGDVPF